jgi:hypothetical protein
MNPKFLKRLKRFGVHYPQGPGLACFSSGEFPQIKALMFELGLGDQMEAFIATSKKVAFDHPSHRETTSFYPVNVHGLPPNPYNAKNAVGSLVLFINRESEVDGVLLLSLPVPNMELNALLLQASMVAEFSKRYGQVKPPEFALIEKPDRSQN